MTSNSVDADEPSQQALLHAPGLAVRSVPFPSPEILKQYENISPGVAEKIVAMVERERQNSMRGRIELARVALTLEHRSKLEQLAGFLAIASASLAIGFYFFKTNDDLGAISFAVGGFGTLILTAASMILSARYAMEATELLRRAEARNE
jgi:uncharacterized membrane protein